MSSFPAEDAEKHATSTNGKDAVDLRQPALVEVDLEHISQIAQPIDPVIASRVLRKIDIFFMPAMVVGKSLSSAFSVQLLIFGSKDMD